MVGQQQADVAVWRRGPSVFVSVEDAGEHVRQNGLSVVLILWMDDVLHPAAPGLRQ